MDGSIICYNLISPLSMARCTKSINASKRDLSLKKLQLDILVNTPDHEIDMQYGLDSLKGTSDVVSLIAEAILEDNIGGRRTHKSNGVRTKLKQSFTGSFGQRFSLDISNQNSRNKLNRMGDDIFLEVLTYFVREALYLDSGNLSPQATKVLDEMGDVSQSLFKRLNKPLIEMHQVSKYYNQNISLRHRKRGADPKQLFNLTNDTCKNITETEIDTEKTVIEVVIVRYHSKTGNGRLHIKDRQEFYSFGFGTEILTVQKTLRKKISANLHINNTENVIEGEYIKLLVKAIRLPTGNIVKYLVIGIEE